VACGPIVGAATAFADWLKQQNRQFLALEMESGGVLAAVFEAADPARMLVLRGVSDYGDERKADLDQTAGGAFRRVAMNNAIGMLDSLLAAGCLPRAEPKVDDSPPESKSPARGASGPHSTLRIAQTAHGDAGHHVQVALEQSGQPTQRAQATFVFALTPQDQEDLRWYLEDYLQHPFDPAPTIASRIEARMAELGGQLFDRVFSTSEQGRRLWARLADTLSDLRVEIVTAVREAHAIPWELIRDPHTDTVLALRAAAFVRTHDEPRETPQPVRAEAGPIRILLVICRPKQAEDVPFRSVASRLVKALTDETRALYQLEMLRPATFESLAARLRAAKQAGRPYHVVHFDGHGMYAEVADNETAAEWLQKLIPLLLSGPRAGTHGYLLFENPQAEENLQLVDGQTLGRLLRETGVPVLVLNACRSAHAEAPQQPPSAESSDEIHAQVQAFGSLAQEVIDCGVTGVVAMRYSVYVVTAAQFVADLYAALLEGAALGEAVTLGRKQLDAQPQRTIAYEPRPLRDWCVPVVYEALPTSLFPPHGEERSPAIKVAAAESTAAAGQLDPDLPPPPDAGFFGRDETLLALDRALDTQSVVLLHAYAGSGKTATVAEFARWYAFTGGVKGPVLFTSFEHYTPLARVLDRIGQVFGAALEQAGVHWLALDDTERRQVAVQVLQQIPVLWIWDNVEPIAGFPAGSPSAWTDAEQRELADFLRAASRTKARFLLTSRRDERAWLGDLPRRIEVPPMPMQERVQLARGLAEKHGRRLTDIEDWRPLLRFTGGNPLAITVLVGQALRDNLHTRDQIEAFVEQLRRGEARVADDAAQGRSRSLAASLQYGFEHAFNEDERRRLALLHFFQGFVDVDALRMMTGDPALLEKNQDAPDWALPELRGLDRETWIGLLDRAAEVGLLSAHGDGYYTIHPALPWFFKGLFDTYFPSPAAGEGSGEGASATRAFVEAMGELGDYYAAQYEGGNRDVIGSLAAEEANLLHARQLARRHAWWDPVISTMQGLRVLYRHAGRRAEWARLVAEIVPDFIDPQTDGPLPGREDRWGMMTEYRVRLAREMRNWPEAERLQRANIDWCRRQAERVLDVVLSRSPDCDRGTTEGLPSTGDESRPERRDLRSGEWPSQETMPQQTETMPQQSGDKSPLSKQADGSRSEPATFLDRLKAVTDRLSDADRNTIRTLAVSLHELGEIQRECRSRDCVAAYEESLVLSEQIGERAGAGTAAFNLGRAHHENIPAIRDLQQAERWYRRSLELFGERDPRRAQCLGQLGYVALQRFQDARSADRPEAELLNHLNAAAGFYHQDLDLLAPTAVNDLAVAHNALGAIYRNAGDIDRALTHFREAIRHFEGAGDLYHAAAARCNAVLALAQSGRVADAREYARAALRNFETYGHGAAQDIQDTQQLLAELGDAPQ